MSAPAATRVSVRPCREGAGEAPRVLLLHGLASSASVWDRFVEGAPDSWRLWVADLPWHADGDPGWAHAHDVSQSVTAAVELTGERIDVVVAHSFAANLWLGVLDAGGPLASTASVLVSPFYRTATAAFDWSTLSYYLNDFHHILEHGIRVRAGDRFRDDLGEEMALRVRARIGPYGWIRFFEAYLRTPFLHPHRLTAPTLVVAGADDFAAAPSDARSLAAALPHARLEVLQPCGHFPMLEQPTRFTALVHEFADRLPSAAVSPRSSAASESHLTGARP